MRWEQIDQYHWRRECGRYFIERTLSLAFPDAPDGRWVYLAHFKRDPRDRECVAECISPKHRLSRQGAMGDCSAHLHPQQRPQAAA